MFMSLLLMLFGLILIRLRQQPGSGYPVRCRAEQLLIQ